MVFFVYKLKKAHKKSRGGTQYPLTAGEKMGSTFHDQYKKEKSREADTLVPTARMYALFRGISAEAS